MHDLITLFVVLVGLALSMLAGVFVGRQSMTDKLLDMERDRDLMRDKLFECMRKEGMRGDP